MWNLLSSMLNCQEWENLADRNQVKKSKVALAIRLFITSQLLQSSRDEGKTLENTMLGDGGGRDGQ